MSNDTNTFSGNADGSGLFSAPPGLLDPALEKNLTNQSMMGMAMGLLQAGGTPSLTKPNLGTIFGGALQGANTAYQNGLNSNLKIQQILMQRKAMSSTYQALVAGGMSPAQAQFYALNSDALKEAVKPQIIPPGAKLTQPISIGGAGGGQPAGGGGVPAPVADAASVANGPIGGGQPQAPVTAPAAAPGGGGATILAQNNDGMLGPDALNQMVQRRLLGDKSVEGGSAFGMGAIGQLNKTAYQTALAAAQQAQGIDAGELTRRSAAFPAYEKGVDTLTQMETRMGTARNEFQNIWPMFEAQVQKVAAGMPLWGKFPAFNQWGQYANEHSGDPDVVQLGNYMTALRNQYIRATSTSKNGPTDADKGHFDEMLSQYWNPAQINSAGQAMGNEMVAAKNSLPAMRSELDQEFGLVPKQKVQANYSGGTPQIPAALASKPGLQYSAKRGLFRDAQGNMYKADGTPAQ